MFLYHLLFTSSKKLRSESVSYSLASSFLKQTTPVKHLTNSNRTITYGKNKRAWYKPFKTISSPCTASKLPSLRPNTGTALGNS